MVRLCGVRLSCWSLAGLTIYAFVSLEGCLPPDWSFCDCDFRDNFWNSVLNDVHLLWDVEDGPDFVRRAQDNTTFQGKYLQSPPDDLSCPVAPSVFWKAWPQYGITRGLIEGSMGDLWMPGARDRFKQVCIAGHIALLAICSQHFLVKSAHAQESGNPDHMKWLEAAYSHMVAIRNLGEAYQIRNCMGQQGWSLDVGAFHRYTERWIGREAEGTAPQAAFFNGKVDPWQMLFTKPMAHTTNTRAAMLPDRKTCAPYKDPSCWKRKSLLLMETCEYCCSPFEHKGGRGAGICWDGEWTYERCCQQDFKDLICELSRKGEEGGCVDCKKTVTYICLTPTEKRLKDAQNKYNDNVDLFNQLQNKSQELARDIQAAREDLLRKDQVYRNLHEDLNNKLSRWHVAYYNASRLSSLARLKQQELTWNNSRAVLDEATRVLNAAQASTLNVSRVLSDARKQEGGGLETLQRNITAYERAVHQFAATSRSLASAKAKKAVAEEEYASADLATTFAENNATQSHAALREANFSRDQQYTLTEASLEQFLASRNASREEASETLYRKHYADAELQAMRTQAGRFCAGSSSPTNREASTRRARLAEQAWETAGATRNQLAEGLSAAQLYEERTKHMIYRCAGRSSGADAGSSLLCLIGKTPANESQAQVGLAPLCGNEACPLQDCMHNVKQSSILPLCSSSLCNDTQSGSQSGAELLGVADLLKQLLTAQRLSQEALTKARRQIGTDLSDNDGSPAVYVPVELTNAVEEMSKAVSEAKKKQGTSSMAVKDASSLLERFKNDLATISDKQRASVTDLDNSDRQARQLAMQISIWEEYVRTNMTFFSEKQRVYMDVTRTADLLAVTAQEAFNRTDLLSSHRLVAINMSILGRRTRDEEAQKLNLAEQQVQRVNRTLSDNLTVLVSAWLQQQETAKASQSGRWSERLLAAAKEVLVTMVGSLESFLDNYIISLSDKDN
ncbi:Uncharacterized protein SCF082_LOCUS19164 [Durusdinium trenchii]|uniref:Uncharacterized protein n=1 Tax=Durusdinium trenchii TaxID=1381693 RepID=A0ABP0KVP5_9DINO